MMKIQGLLLLLILTSASIGCEGMMPNCSLTVCGASIIMKTTTDLTASTCQLNDPLPPRVPVPARSAAFSSAGTGQQFINATNHDCSLVRDVNSDIEAAELPAWLLRFSASS